MDKIFNGKLAVSKIGDIKLIYHRELIGKPKTATIKRTPTVNGLSICCEIDNNILQESNLSVGIDLVFLSLLLFLMEL